MRKSIAILAVLLFVVAMPLCAAAQEGIRVAVAANYIQAFKELAGSFEKETGIKVEATFSSSGNLFSQIDGGAPYDLFLSADEERPRRLHQSGEAGEPFVYARGRVILWSARKDFCAAGDWRDALTREGIKKIAMANPEIAPYGMAAKAALVKAGLWDALQPKIVNAQDIAQTFQYASTEAVDAGLCALSAGCSEKGKAGCFYEVNEAPDIVQGACILKRTEKPEQVERFARFLVSPGAEKIRGKYGYR
jgi:molybdate transport system substrate-binding protein